MALAVAAHTSAVDQSGGFLSAISTSTGLNVPSGAAVVLFATNTGIHNALGTATDTAGNTFTASSQFGVTGDYICRLYYCLNTSANASDIFSVAITGGAGVDTNLGIIAWVITGQDTSAIDVIDGNSQSFITSPVTTPTFSTVTANEIILTAAYLNNTATSFSANNGFTIDETVPTGSQAPYIVGAHSIVSVAQTSVNMSFAWTSGTFARAAAAVISLKQAGGAPASALRINASLSGLGASGPFFHDRLAA